jgi:hypothetical protein
MGVPKSRYSKYSFNKTSKLAAAIMCSRASKPLKQVSLGSARCLITKGFSLWFKPPFNVDAEEDISLLAKDEGTLNQVNL